MPIRPTLRTIATGSALLVFCLAVWLCLMFIGMVIVNLFIHWWPARALIPLGIWIIMSYVFGHCIESMERRSS